jgi:hypothetical protein
VLPRCRNSRRAFLGVYYPGTLMLTPLAAFRRRQFPRFLGFGSVFVACGSVCNRAQSEPGFLKPDLTKQRETIFNNTCATGYCHALRGGTGGGAPPLAARGFEAYLYSVTARGVAGTAMPGFGGTLARPDLTGPARARDSAVSTVTSGGEAMPALVVSKTVRAIIFYDLSAPPPVLHTADPAGVKTARGSSWRHALAIGSYTDAHLESILSYLRSAKL